MNPLSGAKDLARAITFPFTFLFVVGLCALINWFTSPWYWWVQWVAFGMGIALLCVWARALRTIFFTAVLAGFGYLAYRWWHGRPNDESGREARAGAASGSGPQ